MDITKFLVDSFIKYTAITSQSDGSQNHLPTTNGQIVLAKQLKEDLENIGITNVILQNNAILIAKISGDVSIPPISFMAHLDTADIGVSPDVYAQVIEFNGQDIILNQKENIIFKINDYPNIKNYLNESIIFTDGTSILGADDKAGITLMIGLAYYLTQNSYIHGDIYLVFVPDEEVGLRGAYNLDLSKIPVKYSYTLDGGELGEFGYETFNGASVDIHIKGVSVHPGSAKDILVNPILIVNEIISSMDKYDTPEHSENKQGFFLVHDINGNPTEAAIKMIIRDFDLTNFNKRKQQIENIIQQIQQNHPKSVIAYDITDSYANIANTLLADRSSINLVEQAMKNLNIPINISPIRGGTDGSVLSAKGLMTPNIFTGAMNIHSIYEYLPISSFTKSFQTILEMTKLLAKK